MFHRAHVVWSKTASASFKCSSFIHFGAFLKADNDVLLKGHETSLKLAAIAVSEGGRTGKSFIIKNSQNYKVAEKSRYLQE